MGDNENKHYSVYYFKADFNLKKSEASILMNFLVSQSMLLTFRFYIDISMFLMYLRF